MPRPDSSRGSAAFAHLGHRLASAADAHLWAVLEIPRGRAGGKGEKETDRGGGGGAEERQERKGKFES